MKLLFLNEQKKTFIEVKSINNDFSSVDGAKVYRFFVFIFKSNITFISEFPFQMFLRLLIFLRFLERQLTHEDEFRIRNTAFYTESSNIYIKTPCETGSQLFLNNQILLQNCKIHPPFNNRFNYTHGKLIFLKNGMSSINHYYFSYISKSFRFSFFIAFLGKEEYSSIFLIF